MRLRFWGNHNLSRPAAPHKKIMTEKCSHKTCKRLCDDATRKTCSACRARGQKTMRRKREATSGVCLICMRADRPLKMSKTRKLKCCAACSKYNAGYYAESPLIMWMKEQVKRFKSTTCALCGAAPAEEIEHMHPDLKTRHLTHYNLWNGPRGTTMEDRKRIFTEEMAQYRALCGPCRKLRKRERAADLYDGNDTLQGALWAVSQAANE